MHLFNMAKGGGRSIKADTIIEMVIRQLKSDMDDLEVSISSNQNSQQNRQIERERLLKQLDELMNTRSSKMHLLTNPYNIRPSLLEEYLNNIQDDIEKLDSQILYVKNEIANLSEAPVIENKEMILTLHKAIDMLADPGADLVELNTFLKSFIRRIELDLSNKSLVIVYNNAPADPGNDWKFTRKKYGYKRPS